MHQQTYTVRSADEFEQTLERVAASSDYQSARCKVLLIFEPSCDRKHFAQAANTASEKLPDALVAGMTTLGAPCEGVRCQEYTQITFLLFETGEARLFSYNCREVTPYEAGEHFVASTLSMPHLKGVLFMSSCLRVWPAPFIDCVSDAYPRVPVFGAQAGTERLTNDRSLIMANGTIQDRGILAMAFAGEDLHIEADYNMGFRPAGREFQVTRCKTAGFVDDIDEEPAVKIYERFLGVEPGEFFYQNVCAFPLLTSSKSLLVPHVPLDFTPDGRLQFSTDLARDTRLMISYSRPEYLLAETLSAANGMAQFAPQGMVLFDCVNRRVFMGDERADREISYYEHACDDLCCSCGYGEVLKTSDGGGILNSSLVAVGFREGAAPETHPVPLVDPSLLPPHDAPIPFEARLVTFMETVMLELHGTIDGLAVLAERDQLTGLYNRRRMDELLSYEISRLHEGETFGLLVLDIDHFKDINDTYGHEVGDTVLKEVTQCVNDVTRAHDILSRWGGEEFMCLATHASLEQATGLAERIRHYIERHSFTDVGHLTVSIGVANATSADTIRTLFNRADAALYEAKHLGRNRVCSKAVE